MYTYLSSILHFNYFIIVLRIYWVIDQEHHVTLGFSTSVRSVQKESSNTSYYNKYNGQTNFDKCLFELCKQKKLIHKSGKI